GARLNARTHGLFTRTGLSAGPSPRVKQLRDAFARDAITGAVPDCLDELAELQAHIEDIRQVQQTLWQEMREAAGLDQDCQPGTGLSLDDGPGNASRDEGDTDAVTACLAGNDRLDRLSRKLSSLAGYQRRAAGRRRRLVLDILRDRAQRPTRS
ncbi:MAG: hypothetical protein V2I51_13315, partial [Anderseniella sp.]|nr:hypothetical protein [Anderseniella sp.]